MILSLIEQRFRPLITYFLISPGSRYTRKELKEKTGLHNKTLDEALTQLTNLHMLTKKKQLYELIQTDETINNVLQLIQKEQHQLGVPYQVQLLLTELIEWLSRNENIQNVYLFGSYAKQVQHAQSDVDIALITKRELTKQEKSILQVRKGKIEQKYEKKIELHCFTEAEFKKKDAVLTEIHHHSKQLY